MSAAWKNSAISLASGAPPEIAARAAEPILDLGVDEPVGKTMLGCEPEEPAVPVAGARSRAVPRAATSR